MARRVAIEILGPLRLTLDGQEVRLPAKQQVLLAVLALESGPVPAERLVTALWGEDVAPSAYKTLQSHVFQLRRALALGATDDTAAAPAEAPAAGPTGAPGSTDAASIVTEGRGYRLLIADDAVDARRFETSVGEAHRQGASDPRSAVSTLNDALALWRGQAPADVGDEPVATAAFERLLELRHSAFEELIRLRLSLGESAEVIPDLRRELRAYPYREPLWGILMWALDASGRRAEALLAYREATESLRRELDVEPDEELTLLASRIRDGTNERSADGPVIAAFPASSPSAAVTPGAAAVTPGAVAVTPSAGDATPAQATGRSPSQRTRRLGAGVAVLTAVLLLVVLVMRPPTAAVAPTGAPQSTNDPRPSGLVGDANAVELLDPDGQVTARAPVGGRPDAIVAGAGSLWVTNPTQGTVDRIDETAQTVIQHIMVGNGPAGIAYGFGAVWVANSDDRTVSRIDPATDQVLATIDVGTAPTGIAVDDKWVWVTNRLDHSLTRIDPTDGSVWSFALGTTPEGVTVANGSVWVVDAGGSAVAQVDPATGTVERTIAVGSDPTAIAASPNGADVWVTNTGSGTVFRIDTSTAAVTAAQVVGAEPSGISVDSSAVWVTVSGTNEVVRLDPASAAITGRTTMAASPHSVFADGTRVAITSDAATGSHAGGTLRVVEPPGSMSETADPSYTDWEEAPIEILVYDGLVTYKRVSGPDGLTIVPDLAAEIPVAADGGRTWTFRLRPGLVYSNGQPVRASDALVSFERATMGGNATSTGGGLFGDTEIIGSAACGLAPPCDLSNGITTDDQAGTITFHLTAPDATFPSKILAVPLVPSGTPITESSAPLPGTGPYRVASYVAQTSERLVRNPLFREWSHDAQPYGNPDEIDISVSSHADPTVDLLSGSADVLQIGTESADRLAQLRIQVPGQLHVAPPNQTWMELMNTTLPPFNDLRVRQAVNLATDRQTLVTDWGGPLTATVTCQVVPPGFAGYQRYCPWTVDPSDNGNWLGPDLVRARALIDESGTRGQTVVVWGWNDGGQHAAVAGYFAGLLRDLGFKATTRLMGFDEYFSFIEEHPEQVQMAGLWEEKPDRVASEMIVGSFTCPSYAGASYQGQPAEFCDPTIDARVDGALALEGTDPVAADEAWAGIDHAIVDAAPAVIPFNPTAVTIVSARTDGFEAHPLYGILYDQMFVN